MLPIPVIKKSQKNWTRSEVKKDSTSLYIFTDNTVRTSGRYVISSDSWYCKKYGSPKYYPSITSACIRGLNNAFPISTMKYYIPNNIDNAQWKIDDFGLFAATITDEIHTISNAVDNYDRVVLPYRGKIDGGPISKMPEVFIKYLDSLLSLAGIY